MLFLHAQLYGQPTNIHNKTSRVDRNNDADN